MKDLKKIVDRVQLLDDFAGAVADKLYRKMPYADWRNLAHRSDKYIGIVYMIDTHSFKVYTLNLTGGINEVLGEFKDTDNSFGRYLHVKWDRITPVQGGFLNTLSSNYYCDTPTASNATILNGTSYAGNTAGNTVSSTFPLDYSTYSGSISLCDTFINEEKCRKFIREEIEKDKNKNEETSKMNTNDLFHFEFGPVSSNIFRMSPYGLAVRTEKNGWIAYNAKTGDLMDVEVLNFDISKMIYKMPVALSAIAPGDILMHGGKPVFVRDIGTGTLAGPTVNVIDYATASVMDILPVKSPFGFNFFTKVCPLIDMSGMTANPDNPFGNMLPFLMLNGENNDFDPTLLFLAGGMGNMDFSKNPMMLYFLMNRKDKGDLLPFLMMMNGGNFGMAPISAPTPVPVTTLK